MDGNVQFITDLNDLIDAMLILINNEVSLPVLISGAFDNIIYKKILDELLRNNSINRCKIIIPYVTSTGIVSRANINKISAAGGQVKLNSQFRKSIIAIGRNIFILSYSYRYTKDNGIRSFFECGIQTNDQKIIDSINDKFNKLWDKSLPVANF